MRVIMPKYSVEEVMARIMSNKFTAKHKKRYIIMLTIFDLIGFIMGFLFCNEYIGNVRKIYNIIFERMNETVYYSDLGYCGNANLIIYNIFFYILFGGICFGIVFATNRFVPKVLRRMVHWLDYKGIIDLHGIDRSVEKEFFKMYIGVKEIAEIPNIEKADFTIYDDYAEIRMEADDGIKNNTYYLYFGKYKDKICKENCIDLSFLDSLVDELFSDRKSEIIVEVECLDK